jgi:hypothetical protein
VLQLTGRSTRVVTIALAASVVLAGTTSGASARSISKREAASFAAAKKRLTKKQRAKIRRQLMRQVRKNPRSIKSRSFLRRASLVNFVLPVTIRVRNPCPEGTNGAAYCPAGEGNTALNQRTQASANVDLGASLGQRTIGLSGTLAAEVQFRDSYDGGALGNVVVKLLPSNAASKQLKTTSVPILWNPDVSNATEDGTGPIYRYDKGLMDAVRNDPGHGPAIGAFALTRQQGCGDAQEQVPQQASIYNPASTHNPFAHNTRMTSSIITAALAGVPPSPVGDGQPGYSALFADTPYGFVPTPSTGVGLPGFPFYDPAGSAGLLTGVGLLPPTPIDVSSLPGPPAPHLPTAFLPVYWGPERIDNLKSGWQTGDNEILGPDQTPFPYPAIAPGDFTQPPNVRSTMLRTSALTLGIASAGTQVDIATGTGAPPGSSPPQPPYGSPNPTGEGSQNVIIGQSGGEANLFGNIPGKGYGIDVTASLKTTINTIIRVTEQDLWDLPLEEGEEYPAGLFICRQVWTGAVDNYIPGIRLAGSLRISPAITKDGKLRIAKATVTTQQPQGVALTACVMPYSGYVENREQNPTDPGYTTDSNAGKVPTKAQLAVSFPPLTGFLLIPYNSNALGVLLDQRRYSGGGFVSARGNAPTNVPCNAPAVDGVQKTAYYGIIDQQTPASQANGYTTTVDGSKVTVRGDITTNLEVDVLIGDQ